MQAFNLIEEHLWGRGIKPLYPEPDFDAVFVAFFGDTTQYLRDETTFYRNRQTVKVTYTPGSPKGRKETDMATKATALVLRRYRWKPEDPWSYELHQCIVYRNTKGCYAKKYGYRLYFPLYS